MKVKVLSILFALIVFTSVFSTTTTQASFSETKIGTIVSYQRLTGDNIQVKYPTDLACDFAMYNDTTFASTYPTRITFSFQKMFDVSVSSSQLVRQDGMWYARVTFYVIARDAFGGQCTGNLVVDYIA